MQAAEAVLLAALRTQKRAPPATDALSVTAAEMARLSDAGASFKALASTTFDIKRQRALFVLVSSEEVALAQLGTWLEQKLGEVGTCAVREGNTFRIYGVAERIDGRCFLFELAKSAFSVRCVLWRSSGAQTETTLQALASAFLELAASGPLTMHITKAAKAEP